MIFLINIIGKDRVGLFSEIMEILASFQVNILDSGQSVIHEQVNIGLLIEVPENQDTNQLMKDFLFRAHQINIQAKFTSILPNEYEDWVSEQGKERHIITILGRVIKAEHLFKVSQSISAHNLNIDSITRLSGRNSLTINHASSRACVQLSLKGSPPDEGKFRKELFRISENIGVDIAYHQDDIYRRSRRLVVFDMDSTLIQTEVIDELAEVAGVGEEVKAITEAAMQGKLDFNESFKRRLSLLKGLDEDCLIKIAEKLPLTEVAERLTQTLKKMGYKLAIISGGFTYFGQYLQKKLGIDFLYANELEIINGKVTGIVKGEIINGEKKAFYLQALAKQEGLDLQQTIAVGDGANDLPMLKVAGLGVAFHAKQIVKEKASNTISNIGLDGLLYLIGIRDREISRHSLK